MLLLLSPYKVLPLCSYYAHFVIEKTTMYVMYVQIVTLVSVSPSSSSLLPSQIVRMSLSLYWSLFYSLL